MTEEQTPQPNNQVYYILGAVAVAVVAGAIFFLKPQENVTPTPSVSGTETTAVVTNPPPATGPISKLACDQQYYNPVIGFPKYYLSLEGGDLTGPTTVDCKFTVSVTGTMVAEETVKTNLVANADRGGQTFRCTTGALDLAKTVATKVDVTVTDDQGASTSCSKVFSLP